MLQKTGPNLTAIFAIAIICFFLYHQSGILDDAGMAAIFLNWFPFIVALGTAAGYLIVRLITQKWAWIVSALGILLNVWIVISAYIQMAGAVG